VAGGSRQHAGGGRYLLSQGEVVGRGADGERLFTDRFRIPREYRARWRSRLGSWLIGLNRELMDSATRMGVPAAKNPLDAWIYQEIVHDTRPDAIVELGSAYGGGTLFLANLLDLLGGDGIVVSVDVSRDSWQADHPRIVQVTGNSSAPAVVERVTGLCAGRRTMVIHDASHRAGQVLEDLTAYGSLVSPGCYLVVEDGVTDVVPRRVLGADPGAGPFRAADAYLRTGAPFDVDPRRERFLATNNPRGFLRRRDERVGDPGLEPGTSSLSEKRSNRLS
jgi:cephalosporin hydroxylase